MGAKWSSWIKKILLAKKITYGLHNDNFVPRVLQRTNIKIVQPVTVNH
jgi:hypothetical protein